MIDAKTAGQLADACTGSVTVAFMSPQGAILGTGRKMAASLLKKGEGCSHSYI